MKIEYMSSSKPPSISFKGMYYKKDKNGAYDVSDNAAKHFLQFPNWQRKSEVEKPAPVKKISTPKKEMPKKKRKPNSDILKKTIKELRAFAEELGIILPKRAKKQELIDIINEFIS